MTDVFIVDLKTGNVTQLETDPIYSVHHVNAYRANKVNHTGKRNWAFATNSNILLPLSLQPDDVNSFNISNLN